MNIEFPEKHVDRIAKHNLPWGNPAELVGWMQSTSTIPEQLAELYNGAFRKGIEVGLRNVVFENGVPTITMPATDADDEKKIRLQHVWTDEQSMKRPFQDRTSSWAQHTLGVEAFADLDAHNQCVLEASLELIQACGCNHTDAHTLVDSVYARQQGDIKQAVGGLIMRLSVLCAARDLSMFDAAEAELARSWKDAGRIRGQQCSKRGALNLSASWGEFAEHALVKTRWETRAFSFETRLWQTIAAGASGIIVHCYRDMLTKDVSAYEVEFPASLVTMKPWQICSAATSAIPEITKLTS